MIKWSFLSTFFVLLFVSCESTNQRKESDVNAGDIIVPVSASGEENDKLPVLEFDKLEFNFGTIAQGEKATFSFRFRNT